MDIDYKPLKPPRENDKFIMEVISKILNGCDLVAFNRARKRQEATFLSDICTANGSRIDPLYL